MSSSVLPHSRSGRTSSLPPVFGGLEKTRAASYKSSSSGMSPLAKGLLLMVALLLTGIGCLFYSLHVPPDVSASVNGGDKPLNPSSVTNGADGIRRQPDLSERTTLPPLKSRLSGGVFASRTNQIQDQSGPRAQDQPNKPPQGVGVHSGESLDGRDAPAVAVIHTPPPIAGTLPRVPDVVKDKVEGSENRGVEDMRDAEILALETIAKIRKMKYQDKVVIENSPEALKLVAEAQSHLRKHLLEKYGPGRIRVEMTVKFPEYLEHAAAAAAEGPDQRTHVLLIDLAPIESVPYSVYFFLNNILMPFNGGDFHRNAGHVLQAMVRRKADSGKHSNFAWQEYSADFPHKRWTLGYAGRPSNSQALYISTLDNTRNHGPASQGSKTEADAIIGELADEESIELAKVMCKQKGGAKGSGFISDHSHFINIVSFKLVSNNSGQ